MNVDLSQIDKWLQQLLNYDQATSYSKQKDSLRKQLEAFLSALAGQLTLATVTPRYFCRSLIFKDKDGKMQVHCNSSKFIGQHGRHPCGCPQRLSYKTVDTYIGKLRSIFHAEGRDGEWDKRLGLGNPAADKSVKNYLCVVSAEQLQARVTPEHLPLSLWIGSPCYHSTCKDSWRSLQFNGSFSPAIRLISKQLSSVTIDQVIWARSKFLKSYVF